MSNELTNGFRISPQQKHLILLQESDKINAYCAKIAIQIEGNLNQDILKLAIEDIVSRHEILRTTFDYLPGMTIPLQFIAENSLISIHDYNLSDFTPQEQQAKVDALFEETSVKPFELGESTYLDISLLRMSSFKHILLISLPALCADMPTLNNLLQEISLSYTANIHANELSNDVMQYADIAEWLNELLESEDTETGTEYWQKQDISSILTLKVPFENQLLQQRQFRPQSLTLTIDSDTLAKIEALVKNFDTSIGTFLLTCWHILLWRLTGQSDVIVGTRYDGRKYQELKEALGLLAKYLPIHSHIEENFPFKELLERISESLSEIHKWEEYFNCEQIAARNNNFTQPFFFPFSFDFEEQPAKFCAPEVSFSIYKQYACIDKFKIRLSCGFREGYLLLNFSYDSSFFSVDNIRILSEQYRQLLESVISNPKAAISDLSILSEREKEQLLFEWNQTKSEYPENKCIHELFEEQVERTPENIAVVYEKEELTYEQLNQRANQVAHYLQSLGVGAEVLVGICMERSVEMLVGMLGILKAGGAYVPLDPNYPTERLRFMVEDALVPVLLTQQQLMSRLPEHQATVICVDSLEQVIAQQSKSNPLTQVEAENVAYIIYTSGSTGKPKGTVICHRGLVNYLTWCTQAYSVATGEGAPVHSSISFDMTITGLFSPLLVGKRVELLPETVGVEALSLTLQNTSNYSLVKITPAQLEMLNHQLSPQQATGCTRALIIGGENLVAQTTAFWLDFAKDTILINEYGPTETVVGCCTYQVPHGLHESGSIPIGRPIANTQLYILDSHLQPVPIGVSGELYIGGDGLARGYLHRPETTALKFIPHPFSDIPGARLYQTGDLARYLADGNIEYLGRLDHQQKIRGFRIELTEIEAVLNQHPQVRQSVVIVRVDVPGDQRLVAYIVPQQDSAPTITELRSFLLQQLPEYMIPSAFVILDTLPLTINGKVDRSSLKAPESELAKGTVFVSARTPIEEILTKIWSEVLRVEQVGIHDNFFELGGHSLLATQLISRVQTTFTVELRLRSLFENPTVCGFAECIETMLRRGSSLPTLPLIAIARDERMPLSYAQARLWFLEQLESGSAFYIVPAAVQLSGKLDVQALEHSFNQIIRRHEALRTNFATQDGQPVQAIAPTMSLTLPVVDLQDLPKTEREIESQQLTLQEAVRLFDLASEPLVRATLLRLEEAEHILLLTMHHIIADGWSMGVLVQELAVVYEAYCNHLSPVLPELPIQYADFAIWQRQWLQGEVRSSQMAYWKQQLEGSSPLLELPTDRPRRAVQTVRGAHQTFPLSLDLSEALMSLSQQQGVTLFMTLLAAFQILLYRYTGQDDICIGTPIANRNRAEIEGLIGFFVNTLVLRTYLGGDPSFEEVLSRVRNVALGAYTHQDLPFEQLVEELQPERSLRHTPLFQVIFVLQNAPMPSLELPDLTLNLLPVENATSKFDLTLSLFENTKEGLSGVWEYNTDLFDAVTIERIAGNFHTLLQEIVNNPQQRLSDLSMLSEREKEQLLFEWNQTKSEYPENKCIHELFEEQVERTPENIAVVYEKEELTYEQLNQRANQVAHYLQSLGVGAEVLVGICMERSVEMLVGMLGILKAGGAYVPLDPNYPTERLRFMVEDALVPVLLTQQQLMSRLPEHQATVICVDSLEQVIAQQSKSNPLTQVEAENVAYIIYTSGSTGKPKGTVICHRGLVNYLTWCTQAYSVATGEGAPVHSSISFDMTITGLFSPLLVGKRVELLPETVGVEALSLTLQNTSNYSLVKITPAQLEMLNHQLSPQQATGCTRALIIGGENLVAQTTAFWLDFAKDTILINEYGPTETVVGCCTYQVPHGLHESGSIPIGRPIANTQLYILDSHLQPVPIGVSGELYIGGDGLARGYLHRPETTALKFIPHPFSDIPGARLYQTGDLARYLADGNIEYLGRLDHQQKIRGFRIELTEIEAVLNQHPQVRQSVVIVRVDVPGDQRLVAYIVPQQDSAPTITELRSFLLQQLPEYMLPSAFVILDTFPLTINGKVDRQALPVPQMVRPELEQTFVSARTPIEEILTRIWSEVLRVEQVGIHDNFFELGGDSILIIQIVARAKQVGLLLTPKQLFEHKTIAKLATVASTTWVQVEQGLVIGKLPLTPIQHWFFNQNLPEPAHWNQAVWLEVDSEIDPLILKQVVQQLVIHHDALRLRFENSHSGWQQVNAAPDDTVPFNYFDLSALSEAEQKFAWETTADQLQTSLNLENGPLIQVAFFALGVHKFNRLFIVIHHLAIDGVSWRILLEDLQIGYQQVSQGQIVQLPLKTTSFKHWAQKLTEHVCSGAFNPELVYWQRQLEKQVSHIPTDLTGGANIEASAHTVSVVLTVKETLVLLQEISKTYNTQINEVLLTALLQVYCQWSGSNSLLLDLEGHGREDLFEDIDLSRTVGWLTTIFPMFLEMEATDDLGDILKSVKEQLRRIPNKGIGYGLLRYLSEDENIVSSLKGLAPAQVSFNYLGQFDQVLPANSMLQLVTQSGDHSRSQQGCRSHLLDITGFIIGGQLQIDWTYSKNVHRLSTIESLAQQFVVVLQSLIAHCLSSDSSGLTPSDFPLADLNFDELEQALTSLES